jgi:DNA polymerase III delta prime subunit/DNA-binding transcriptional ArsR family regulator
MWYKAFGWEENPFSIRPSPNVIGLEEIKEALLEDLLSGSPALLLGPTGMGKTSLLLWLKGQLSQTKFRPVYLNLHALPKPQELSIQRTLGREILLQRLRLRFSQGLILLLDEAQELTAPLAELIKAGFDRGSISAFLLAAQEEPPLPPPLRSRIGPHLYRLQTLGIPERLALLKHRMDGKNPFTEEALLLLAERSGESPRALLQAAELACKRLKFKAELAEPITAADLSPYLPATKAGATKIDETPVPTVSHQAKAPEATPRQEKISTETERDKMAATKPSETNVSETALPSVSHPRKMRETQSQSVSRNGQRLPSETKARETQTPSLSRKGRERKPVLELSPMQRELLEKLLSGPKSVTELCEALGSPAGSVRRQLSRLRQPGHGLPPLVEEIPNSNPKKFGLTAEAHKILAQNRAGGA